MAIIANVALTDTFDLWRTRTNQLAVQSNGFEAYIINLYERSNNSPTYVYANNIGTQANAYTNSAISAANVAVGNGANAYSRMIGASSNSYTNTAISTANVAVGNGANAYSRVIGTSSNGYAVFVGASANSSTDTKVANEAALARNATNLTSGTIPVARVSGNYNLITGLGTITSGVWNGTDIALADGGTNASLTASAGAVAYSTSSAFAFTAVGGSGQLLQSGATGAPSWVSPASLIVSRSSTTGTADNSNLLGGYSLQFGNVNGVAGRDGAGDITGRLFRAEYADQSTISGAIAYRINNTTDNYTRYCSSPSAVRGWLGTGDELIAALATNTGATGIGFSADLNPYRKIWVSAMGTSHNNNNGTTNRYFRINGNQCSQAYSASGTWYGFVVIDLFSGVGIYCDDGTVVNANPFGVSKASGGFTFTTSLGSNNQAGAFDGGTIYVWGER